MSEKNSSVQDATKSENQALWEIRCEEVNPLGYTQPKRCDVVTLGSTQSMLGASGCGGLTHRALRRVLPQFVKVG